MTRDRAMQLLSAAAAAMNPLDPTSVLALTEASLAQSTAAAAFERTEAALEAAGREQQDLQRAVDTAEQGQASVKCAALPSSKIASLSEEEKGALAQELDDAYSSRFEGKRCVHM